MLTCGLRAGRAAVLIASLLAPFSLTALAQPYGEVPILLEAHADPFDYASEARPVEHMPLKAARAHWHLCAIFPHIKDEYWLSVAYGMAEEARRLGVSLSISESGGYQSVEAQVRRLEDCKGDAAIIGAVSYGSPLLLDAIAAVARRMPVIAAINDVGSPAIAAKIGVSWADMGRAVGRYIAEKHPAGSAPKSAVVATGPREAGWVTFLSRGLARELDGSSVIVRETGWADTGPQEQLALAEDLLGNGKPPDYFIGSAPAAEAVVSLKRMRDLNPGMAIIATYFTQAVRRGIMRDRIEAAPYDDPTLQGRLSVEYAVRAVEGTVDHRQIGPSIKLVTKSSLPPPSALAPADFEPVFALP